MDRQQTAGPYTYFKNCNSKNFAVGKSGEPIPVRNTNMPYNGEGKLNAYPQQPYTSDSSLVLHHYTPNNFSPKGNLMLNSIFNYQTSEDKAEAISQFLDDQSVKVTLTHGVVFSAAAYLVGFAATRVVQSVNTRFSEHRYDRAAAKELV